ncbi:hypothetical protein M9H77_31183 [Catharanthus roseus]|uniref:Uncharacterized protein n=1 Tax=Catharanthus roseus TaxID=4058 RepID=A0ACB9ZZQ4_CATRO|nr:hypothetical protein M9H77_31183 [Catharanthus roseus]
MKEEVIASSKDLSRSISSYRIHVLGNSFPSYGSPTSLASIGGLLQAGSDHLQYTGLRRKGLGYKRFQYDSFPVFQGPKSLIWPGKTALLWAQEAKGMSSAASPPHFFFFVPVPRALRAPLALCAPLILSLDGSDGLRRSFPTKIERVVSHQDVDSFSAPNEMGNLEPPIYTFFWALHLSESKPGPAHVFQLPAGSTSVYDRAQ